MKEDWVNKLNLFTEPQLRSEILKHGKVIQAKRGDVLIKEGQRLNFLPIVIQGKIRVYQQKDDREILLYYVGPQETCMMSLSAAYMDYNSAAFGMATEDSEILILPAYLIADWQLKYPSWNQYIIRTYKTRYDELLNSFGSVAFKPIALRLKDYLLSNAHTNNSKKVLVSHQTLANELGTTRVIISRILKQFEKEKILKLGRGYMELV